jgi:hypothetical protein
MPVGWAWHVWHGSEGQAARQPGRAVRKEPSASPYPSHNMTWSDSDRRGCEGAKAQITAMTRICTCRKGATQS